MKRCNTCGEEKPFDQFYLYKKNGRYRPISRCKHCHKEVTRDNYNRRQDSRRGYRVSVEYGLTPDEYSVIYDGQGGVCAICKSPEIVIGNNGAIRALCVDHDHATGAVRGLLCNNCNQGIGRFQDNVNLLSEAIRYLQAAARG